MAQKIREYKEISIIEDNIYEIIDWLTSWHFEQEIRIEGTSEIITNKLLELKKLVLNQNDHFTVAVAKFAGEIFYIHVTVHRHRFRFKQPTRRNNYPILFCYKILHVSGIFSTHHREFSTYIWHCYVSCRFLMTASKQSQDRVLTLLGSGHQRNLPLPNVQ